MKLQVSHLLAWITCVQTVSSNLSLSYKYFVYSERYSIHIFNIVATLPSSNVKTKTLGKKWNNNNLTWYNMWFFLSCTTICHSFRFKMSFRGGGGACSLLCAVSMYILYLCVFTGTSYCTAQYLLVSWNTIEITLYWHLNRSSNRHKPISKCWLYADDNYESSVDGVCLRYIMSCFYDFIITTKSFPHSIFLCVWCVLYCCLCIYVVHTITQLNRVIGVLSQPVNYNLLHITNIVYENKYL